jgi:hypothetical protein
VTLPEPELADGAVDAGERLLPVLELPVLELPDVPEAEVPDVPVLPAVAVEPELPEVACCAPGSANATAPAAAMLTAPEVAVTARNRACPRSRSATARLVACGCLLIRWFLLARFRTQPRRQGWATSLASL